MTSISATTTSPYYALLNTGSSATKTAGSSTSSSGSSSSDATSVTLSDAAKAALAAKPLATVIAETRAALDKLAAARDPASTAGLDLRSLDRRAVFAVATNAGSSFSAAEQTAAQTELTTRQDAALASPLAVARVTGDIEGLYTAAITYLDNASSEEKATPAWATKKDALLQAQRDLAADPDTMPTVDGDIVADYITQQTAGETADTPRAFSGVASDARIALDKQYADAKAAGKELVFSATRKTGQLVDFASFNSRSLSAVALNTGNAFSAEEVTAAKTEIRARSSATVLAGYTSAGKSGGTGDFAKNIISAYGSMSAQERSAAGWSDQLYAAAVASYKSATSFDKMFGDSSSTGGASSLLGTADATSSSPALSLLGSATDSSSGGDNGMSLVDYL